MPVERNRVEREAMRLKASVSPYYVPRISFIDSENHVFISDDLSALKVMRCEMGALRYLGAHLPELIGDFLAKSSFYLSYLYVNASDFRCMNSRFQNNYMRAIMERMLFDPTDFGMQGVRQDAGVAEMAQTFWKDPALRPLCLKFKHIYMQKNECLIHGDFHASNIYIDRGVMKTNDMEFAFVGPFSYDLGYLYSSLIAQYSVCMCLYPEYGQAAIDYAAYILTLIRDIYKCYCNSFDSCWNSDVKVNYRMLRGFKDNLELSCLREMFGFAACANISHMTVLQFYPNHNKICSAKRRMISRLLSLSISRYLLESCMDYMTIDEPVRDISAVTEQFLKKYAIDEMFVKA